MARQAALLLLTVHGYELPGRSVTNDFYRQALDLDLRSKQEFTGEILTAMGGISRFYFSRYKALLRLSDEAIEMADRHDIDEKKLRYVIGLPPEYHAEIIRQIVDLNLTSKQVREICEGEDIDNAEKTVEDRPALPRTAVQIARAARHSGEMTGTDLARALLQQEGDRNLAHARLQMMWQLLDDAEQHLMSE